MIVRCDCGAAPGRRSKYILQVEKFITKPEWSHDARTFP